MKYYDIKIHFILNENEYKKYSENIDNAIDLVLPYGKDYDLDENELFEF